MASLVEIGNPIKLNAEADPGGNINKIFRRGMKIVDIVPVDFTLALQNLTSAASGKYIVAYDFKTPMGKYRNLCSKYKVGAGDGIRLLTNDETVMSEEISNEFSNNKVSDIINSISSNSSLQIARDVARSFGGGDIIGKAGDAITKALDAVGAGGATKAGLGIVGNAVAEGKHVSLPRVWRQSTYTPSLSLSVKLVSPYGHPNSIAQHIIKPLIQLSLLSAPISTDGLTYGKAPYVYVNAYGITNINIGYIESVSIRRGGDDVTYNKHRQPLTLDIAVSIKPALDGFAAMDDPLTPVSTGSDAASDFASFGPSDGYGPGFTSLGNIINSLRPMPERTDESLAISVGPSITTQMVADDAVAKVKSAVGGNNETTTADPKANATTANKSTAGKKSSDNTANAFTNMATE